MHKIMTLFMLFVLPIRAGLSVAAPTNPNLTPGFTGSNPPEASLKHHELSAKSHQSLLQKNSAGELVTTSAATRPQIKVSSSEQLIRDADKIVQNPERALETEVEEIEEHQEEKDKQTYICEQYGVVCGRVQGTTLRILPCIKTSENNMFPSQW